jgi:Fe-S cluster assembly protein SufD
MLAAADVRAGDSSRAPHWWNQLSNDLMAKCLESGLPTSRIEEWKYTSLTSFKDKSRTVNLGAVDITAAREIRVMRLSQVEGDAVLSSLEKTAVRALLESKSDIYFENLAKGFVSDPYVLFVPAGYKSDAAIELAWRSANDGHWGFAVAVIVVGRGADVSLIEKYGAGADAQTQATFLEIGADAKVSHLRLQTGAGVSDQGFVFASTRAKVRENAKYDTAQVSFGSRLSREDLTVELCSAGAEVTTDGVFIGRSNQLVDHHTNLVHVVGNTTSRQIYKGLLADESRGVFNGRIAIAKNASGSNSSQMNKNLLLSKKVELDTKPQLEIDNDDVKAAHGAAIGRLDPDQLFYLRSRGISMSEAVAMLARGFADEAVQRLESPALRKLGTAEIERGLDGLSWEAL